MHREAQRALGADPVMKRLIAVVGDCGLPRPKRFSPFVSLARAITFQQLHGAAASSIFARFVALHAPARAPTPQAVLARRETELRACGLSAAKIAAIRDLAAKCLDGTVPGAAALARMANDEIVARLTEVRGIGRWTVEMLLMFQLGRTDVLPVDDYGVRNGLRLAYGLSRMPRARALGEFGARWAPHRSIAAWYLWRACDLGREGRLPAPRGKPPRIALEPRRTAKRAGAAQSAGAAKRSLRKRAAAKRSAGK